MTTYCQEVTVCQSADTLAEESMCRFMCLQYPQTSFFLLIEALSPYRIQQHSARQSLQELLILEQDFCLSSIFQSIEYSFPSSLSEWTYLLNLVLVRYFSYRNVVTWPCTLDYSNKTFKEITFKLLMQLKEKANGSAWIDNVGQIINYVM